MKHITQIIRTAFILYILLLSSACGNSPTTDPPPVNVPLWNEYPLDKIMDAIKQKPDALLFSSTITFKERPQFYEGSMPLQVLSQKESILGFGSGITLFTQFEEWTTFYLHMDQSLAASGIATGARTYDNSGQLVAESRFERILENEGILILEVHYNTNGSIRFWCNSQIDFSGRKISEINVHGTKAKEYYFVWSASSDSP